MTLRRGKRVTLGVGLLVSTALIACSAPSQALASAHVRKAGDVRETAIASIDAIDTTQLDAITQTDPFAGDSFDAETGTAVAYVSSPPSAAQLKELQSVDLPSGWHLSTTQVSNSWSTLTTIMNKITQGTFNADITEQLASWNIDPSTNSVQVGLVSPTASVESALKLALGTPSLTFLARNRATPAVTKYRDDEVSAPYHAGGKIQTSVPGYVVGGSAGFYMTVGGNDEMLSAGHLGMGHGNSEIDTSTGGHKIGNVVHRSVTDGGFDSEYYSGSFSTYAWIGIPHSMTGNAVTGSYSPAQGASICQDGAYTGEKCGIIMNSPSDACVVFDYTPAPYNGNMTKICSLRYAYAPSGIAISEGDSGGPVIVDDGSTVRAVGLNVGEEGKGQTSGGMWYHPIARVLSYWGGSLVTN